MKCPKENRGSGVLVVLRGLWRRGSVLEGRVQVRGGVRRPHALPSEVRGARGRRLLQRLVLLWARGTSRGLKRPGILARQPCTGAAVAPSTLPSWTHEDTSVHARGRDRSPEERRTRHITAAGDEDPFTSGVCLITRCQTCCFSAPPLSTPLPSGAWWRAANKGRGDADN